MEKRQTVEEVFEDFKKRRQGIIKALTIDTEEFFKQCDPELENLCLFGLLDGEWEVKLPPEEAPPIHTEPESGINFIRDKMGRMEWLSEVAVYSDIWLLSLSFLIGAGCGFDKPDRRRLFALLNSLPTVYETVNLSKSPLTEKGKECLLSDVESEDEFIPGEYVCGACSKNLIGGTKWIYCADCNKEYHIPCVGISPDLTEEQFKDLEFKCRHVGKECQNELEL